MNLKEKMQNQNVLGTMISLYGHVEMPKILKVSGFDFFMIDCEHSAMTYREVETMIVAARECNMPALVRIPELRREVVLKYLEMGTKGIMLPNMETPEQAKKFVEYSKYAPMGKRGVSSLRSHTGFEKQVDFKSYMKRANDEIILIAQIESEIGLKNAEDIIEVEGIDLLLVGPSDLSQDLGIFGENDNPKLIRAIEKVIETAQKHNKYSGIHLMSCKLLNNWIEKGMRFNMWSNEFAIMMEGAKKNISLIKK